MRVNGIGRVGYDSPFGQSKRQIILALHIRFRPKARFGVPSVFLWLAGVPHHPAAEMIAYNALATRRDFNAF